MRTVAFSDAGIVKLLGDKFVCAWVNRRPDLKFKDGLYPKGWRPRGLPNGAAVTNVTSVFADSDGKVIHAMPGYLDAAGFKRHLEYALNLQLQISIADVEDRANVYEDSHTDAAKVAKDDNEGEAHKLLAKRFMRVDEFKFEFFDGLGNVFR